MFQAFLSLKDNVTVTDQRVALLARLLINVDPVRDPFLHSKAVEEWRIIHSTIAGCACFHEGKYVVLFFSAGGF